MNIDAPNTLSRRERQIMDVLYSCENGATVQQVRDALPDPPSYSSVRTLLGILEGKGHVAHRTDGVRYIYEPTRARQNAALGALRQLVQTFFGGSPAQAALTLLSHEETCLSPDDIERLTALTAQARQEGGAAATNTDAALAEPLSVPESVRQHL